MFKIYGFFIGLMGEQTENLDELLAGLRSKFDELQAKARELSIKARKATSSFNVDLKIELKKYKKANPKPSIFHPAERNNWYDGRDAVEKKLNAEYNNNPDAVAWREFVKKCPHKVENGECAFCGRSFIRCCDPDAVAFFGGYI